jgi:hypothetical protein
MGKKFCSMYPGRAVWQLDWWHLFNYIHKGCKFEKDLEREIIELVHVKKLDEALALLSEYHTAMASMEKKLKEAIIAVNSSSPPLIKPHVFWSSHRRNAERILAMRALFC